MSAAALPPADRLRIVILGLSITSSWGNGHATTYRGWSGHCAGVVIRCCSWSAMRRGTATLAICRSRPLVRPGFTTVSPSCASAGRRSGHRRLLRSGWDRGRRAGAADRRRAHRLLRHRHPGHSGRARGRTLRYLTPELIPGFDLYLSFTGGPLLRRIEDEFGGAGGARAIARSIRTAIVRPRCRPDWTSAI